MTNNPTASRGLRPLLPCSYNPFTTKMEPPAFTLPTIHLNGTDAADLEAQYRAVRHVISMAIRTLGHATCNARDFYPQGPGAYEKAVKERQQAFEHLSAAAEYVEAWNACAYDALREKRVQRNRAQGPSDHTPEPTTDS